MRLEKAAPQPCGPGCVRGQKGAGPHPPGPPHVPLTSWGQRSLPICFSTLRSRSRSSCSLPSEASVSEGWGQAQPQCPSPRAPPLPRTTATDVRGQAQGGKEGSVVRAGRVRWGGRRGGLWPVASGWTGRQRAGAHLGAVLGHGVVVEARLGLELLPAVPALEGILQLQTQNQNREKLPGAPPPLNPGGQPYLLTHLHVLLEPHEGLSGDHVARGADSLPPLVDGPLPLFLRATCGAGPGPQGLSWAPRRPGRQAEPRVHTQPPVCVAQDPPQSRPRPGPATQQPPPGAGWATGAGPSLLTVLAGAGTFFRTSSGLGPSCLLARWPRDLSSALARPVCTRRVGQVWAKGMGTPVPSPVPQVPGCLGPHL